MTTQNQSATEEKKYFNLYIQGFGYLNNVRTFTHRRKSYLKVTVTALQGPADEVDYKYFHCTVVGTEAKQLISHCAEEINSGQTVFVRFTLSELLVFTTNQQHGEHRGQPTAALGSNLLSLSMIKINGEVVYTAPPKEPSSNVGPANTTDIPDALDTTDMPVTAHDWEAADSGDPIDTTEPSAVSHHAG
ncbi:DUF3577 domain-containing protein [Pseudomonas batumici]|uniref:DUF3577 domain-containing protein n=1 Tax=Pseudomonas batumici TaxID=226910 RepID=UPI0030D10F8B